jgi:hypothetical protein
LESQRITQVRRVVGGSERTMTMEVTDYNPARSFAFRGIDGPIRAVGKSVIEPLDGGTRSRVTTELEFKGHGFGRLLVPRVRGQARKELASAPGRRIPRKPVTIIRIQDGRPAFYRTVASG